jgi:cysteine desulfurase
MSTNPRIYLDHNATSPLVEPARRALAETIGCLGNPSSIHAEGRRVRDLIERARNQLAALFGRPREQVVFTSGGTESNLLGVRTLVAAASVRGLPRVIATSALEHPSLRAAVEATGWEVRLLEVSPDGVLPRWLDGVGVLAVAAINHELGTVLDPSVLAAARTAGALIHVDAVQAAGKRDLAFEADSVAISAHKLGGPQGVGAVALAIDAEAGSGGHQERGRRGGTENTLGIVGFGAAAEAVELASWATVVALGERLELGLRSIPDVRIHGAGAARIGGTINAGFAGARGEAIVIALDLAGVAVSTGAACTSGTVQPSPVLLALGQSPEQAREAVRFSLGRTNSVAEIDRVLELLPTIVQRARAHRAR